MRQRICWVRWRWSRCRDTIYGLWGRGPLLFIGEDARENKSTGGSCLGEEPTGRGCVFRLLRGDIETIEGEIWRRLRGRFRDFEIWGLSSGCR